VWLAVFYTFMPLDLKVPQDVDGRLLPKEHHGHMRTHLECPVDQQRQVGRLGNPKERARRDIFWVDSDGHNAEEVAQAVAAALRAQGLPWFERNARLELALADVESSRDCYDKYNKAAVLAREVGDRQRWQKYAMLAEAEADRIGRPVDRLARYGI
jgi:hypothetical protein